MPKQFCSLNGGPSLLHDALRRAEAAAVQDRICTVVAEKHRRWWADCLDPLPAGNVIVQPSNRGTANGILLPLLSILNRDPGARLVLLPSDHHVRDEALLARALRASAGSSAPACAPILLLGLQPKEPDPELGYILPGRTHSSGHLEVERFIEKPPVEAAATLIRRGALWNAFIISADGQALLSLFERRCPDVVAAMQSVIERGHRTALMELYEHLPDLDFSRHILPGQEHRLRVLPVPPCGWSDLGTPQRVVDALRDLPRHSPKAAISGPWGAVLSLAEQLAALGTSLSGIASAWS